METEIDKICIQNGVPTLTIVESRSNDPDSTDDDILLYF
jgi:hypothetical protein